MIKYFLIPMTDPPYSKENNQRPRYMDDLKINWTGSPLPKAKAYIVKAASNPVKLLQLQNSPGVIDFPNIESDLVETLPEDRKLKNKDILKSVGTVEKKGEKVGEFINRIARVEGNFNWDKDLLFVPDED